MVAAVESEKDKQSALYHNTTYYQSCVFTTHHYCVSLCTDNIFIASTTEQQHVCDRRTVCRRLNDYGFTIRL